MILDLHLVHGVAAYTELKRLVAADRDVIVYTMRDSQDAALNYFRPLITVPPLR